MVTPESIFVKSYKKHFLYETDLTWADEGPGFEAMDLFLPRHNKSVRIGHGICMDINPKEFTAPYEDFEFATFLKNEKC